MKVLLYFPIGSDLKEVHEAISYLKRNGMIPVAPILMNLEPDREFHYQICKSLLYNCDELWIYGNDNTAHRLHGYARKIVKCTNILCPDYFTNDFRELMNPTHDII